MLEGIVILTGQILLNLGLGCAHVIRKIIIVVVGVSCSGPPAAVVVIIIRPVSIPSCGGLLLLSCDSLGRIIQQNLLHQPELGISRCDSPFDHLVVSPALVYYYYQTIIKINFRVVNILIQ